MRTRTIALLLLLSACGGPSSLPRPPSNQEAPTDRPAAPSATAPPEVTVAMIAGTGLLPGTGTVSASLSDTAGAAVAGATLVATSAALQGSQTGLTDEQGRCDIRDLPAGRYTITVYYADLTFEHQLEVAGGRVTQLQIAKWDLRSPEGEIIEIRGAP